MIDHILCFPSREACPIPLRDAPSWLDGHRTYMPVEVVFADGVMDPDWDGPEARWLEPRLTAPGWWLVARTAERDPEVEGQDYCLVVVDPERGAAGEPFVHVLKLQPTTPLGRVEPTFSGDQYHFPTGFAVDLAPWTIA